MHYTYSITYKSSSDWTLDGHSVNTKHAWKPVLTAKYRPAWWHYVDVLYMIACYLYKEITNEYFKGAQEHIYTNERYRLHINVSSDY